MADDLRRYAAHHALPVQQHRARSRCAEMTVGWAQEQLPQPTKLERWVGEGGWLVDLLLPSTDAGVLFQAVVVVAVFALLFRRAREAALLQLWVGSFAFVAGLFMLRASH